MTEQKFELIKCPVCGEKQGRLVLHCSKCSEDTVDINIENMQTLQVSNTALKGALREAIRLLKQEACICGSEDNCPCHIQTFIKKSEELLK